MGLADPDIQAYLRWRSAASIATYAHAEPDEYLQVISTALGTGITSVLTSSLPTTDRDAEVARRQQTGFSTVTTFDDNDGTAQHASAATARGAAATPAAPRRARAPLAIPALEPPAWAPATPPPLPLLPSPAFLATPGDVLDKATVEVGTAVAVEFDSPAHGFHKGIVRRCLPTRARVLFADGDSFDVNYALLCSIARDTHTHTHTP